MKEAVPCSVPRLRALVLLVLSAVSLPSPAAGAVEAPDPPVTRAEQVVDDVHGVEIADPYRWLEDGSSEEVRRWVESQSAYTRGLLEARPGRDAARRRLAKLLSIGTLTAPTPKGGRYFYTRREGEQNQPILYVRDSLKGKDLALVDPKALSPDGTAAIDWWYLSEDGSLLAYGVSISGDEKSTLRVLDVATGKALADVIPHTRYCALGWLADNSGFYYTRYPAPGDVPAGQENYNRHIFFHRLGVDWSKDSKVFGDRRKPEEIIELSVSPDGRYMVVWVLEGWSRSDLYVKDLKGEGSPFVPVAEGIDALFQGEVIGDTLYLLTNLEAPRYRLLAVDPRKPDRAAWKVLIPQGDAVLSEVHFIGGQLVALYLKDAASRLTVYSREGRRVRDVQLPALGTIEKVDGRYDGQAAFFDFTSFTVPPSVYRLDIKT